MFRLRSAKGFKGNFLHKMLFQQDIVLVVTWIRNDIIIGAVRGRFGVMCGRLFGQLRSRRRLRRRKSGGGK
jgi:hypothetical protein